MAMKDMERIGGKWQRSGTVRGVEGMNLNSLLQELATEKSLSVVVENSRDEVEDIMGAPCAQEIPGWQGTGKSPSLSEPTQ